MTTDFVTVEERTARALERIATALEQAALERLPEPAATRPEPLSGSIGYTNPGTYTVTGGTTGPSTPEPPFPSAEFRQSRDLPPTPFLPISWTCPVHHESKIQPAGVSRSGETYDAFLKCPAKLPDGRWCPEKPPQARPRR